MARQIREWVTGYSGDALTLAGNLRSAVARLDAITAAEEEERRLGELWIRVQADLTVFRSALVRVEGSMTQQLGVRLAALMEAADTSMTSVLEAIVDKSEAYLAAASGWREAMDRLPETHDYAGAAAAYHAEKRLADDILWLADHAVAMNRQPTRCDCRLSPEDHGRDAHLLHDAGFSRAPLFERWSAPAVRERWTLRAKSDALRLAATPSAEGLRITRTAEAGPIRVQQGLDAARIGGDCGSLVLRISVGEDEPGAVAWAAIIQSSPGTGDWTFFRKFRLEEEPIAAGSVFGGSIDASGFDAAFDYELCVQMEASDTSLDLHEIDLVAIPRKADTAGQETTAPIGQGGSRANALVIAWDMGHNPVGRAHLLAEMLAQSGNVALLGPQFDRYGSELWAPLRGMTLPHRSFAASAMRDFLEGAVEAAAKADPDVVVVSKARFPSMLLAMLIKHRTGAPVVLDIDDHELSFFADRSPLSLLDLLRDDGALGDLDMPFGESWTRLAEGLVGGFDGITTSNAALRQRFGGEIVRHARDGARFRPDAAARTATRADFGIAAEDRVILFLGTPRAHKGVVRLAEAIARLGDPNLRLCVIGTANRDMAARLRAVAGARIDLLPDQSWERLPDLVRMADGIALLQDPGSPVAEYQFPAKLTDALASGVPVAITDVAPLADVPADVAVRIKDDGDLDAFLRKIAAAPQAATWDTAGRAYFERELSYAANAPRLEALIDRVRAAPPVWPGQWSRIFDYLSDRWDVSLPHGRPDWSPQKLSAPPLRRGARFDVAFFWKQNDSGLYGRRHDMIAKYLAESGRVGRIIQFDAPIAGRNLTQQARPDAGPVLDHGSLIASGAIERFLGVADDARIQRRTFIHSSGRKAESLLGRALPRRDEYTQWVADVFGERHEGRPIISWVAPVADDYPAVHDAIGFPLAIADLVDDQRAMDQQPERRARTAQSYAETLRRADIVFANCDSVADAFSSFRQDAVIVPNAAEAFAPLGAPPRIGGVEGPVAGYVGNLRDRIDVALIERLARERPALTIALIGSAHGDPPVLKLRDLPNVRFLGVKRYEEAVDYIRGFDVAIMPHLDNAITRVMNPLKLYVYGAAGVPVVTTQVANIAELAPFVHVARDAEDFIAAIDLAIAAPRGARPALPPQMTWPARIETILATIDDYLG
ncbi:glycosyltransferase family 4 protein [Sphingomonas sp. ID0503]|uniref:glycosyltransferase family 4 protein n=1 Tax=Sphingomonas sp. ID0503 TaxID=3399691 RepID=UPI003AFA1B19